MMKTFLKKNINLFRGLLLLSSFRRSQLKNIIESDVVFFFPYYHTGGAERVHLNIVQALTTLNCCVVFTHGSATTNFLEDFKEVASVIELNPILNKRSAFVSKSLRSLIVKAINNSDSVKKVFGCNTNYFYELIPFLKTNLKKFDLIHALAQNDSRASALAMSARLINSRIVINEKAKKDIQAIYDYNNLDKKYINQIQVILNGIKLSEINILNKSYQPLRVGFIGRWSDEKRPEVFLKIVKGIRLKYPTIDFVMAGTGMKSNLSKINDAGVVFLGEITNTKKLNDLYWSLNMVVICSKYEGFPMVLMESMPYGVVPICTNVGGIHEHITNNENGLLIDKTNESEIIKAFIKEIEALIGNDEKFRRISTNASNYSIENFGIEKFNKAYKSLLS